MENKKTKLNILSFTKSWEFFFHETHESFSKEIPHPSRVTSFYPQFHFNKPWTFSLMSFFCTKKPPQKIHYTSSPLKIGLLPYKEIILPETNSSPLKIDGWFKWFSFWDALVSGAMLVSGWVVFQQHLRDWKHRQLPPPSALRCWPGRSAENHRSSGWFSGDLKSCLYMKNIYIYTYIKQIYQQHFWMNIYIYIYVYICMYTLNTYIKSLRTSMCIAQKPTGLSRYTSKEQTACPKKHSFQRRSGCLFFLGDRSSGHWVQKWWRPFKVFRLISVDLLLPCSARTLKWKIFNEKWGNPGKQRKLGKSGGNIT